MLPGTAEAVVVGAGIAGAAAARFLRRAGVAPLVLEALPLAAALTTGAATGAFRLQRESAEDLQLAREAVGWLEAFEELTGQSEHAPGLQRRGYLWVTTEPARAREQADLVAAQREWGLDDVELLDAQAVGRGFPYLGPEVLQARFRAGDGFLDPRELVLGLLAGIPVVTDCPVTGLDVDAAGVAAVRTPRGTVATRTVVVAAGPFAGAVAALAGVALPLVHVSRHKLVVPVAPEVPPDAPMVIDDDTGTHWRPALHGAVALHLDPAEPPGDPLQEVPGDRRLALRILDPASPIAAARTAPFWREVWERRRPWLQQSGQYTFAPDGRPLLGAAEVDGLWVSAAWGGHGVMDGPAGGRILADLVTGALAASPYAPDRAFGAPVTGRI